jgi:LmbE family N-acetylglucosaminyl deacetylase
MKLTKNETLLVIAPHPDDEVIGCAGLIQLVKKQGGRVYVQYLTNGNTKDFSKKGFSTATQRNKEIKNVASFLSYDTYHIAWANNSKHLRLDVHGQKAVMELIERTSPIAIEKIHPSIIAFPGYTSYNQDHRVASRAALAALRSAEPDTKHFVRTVLMYEMPADSWSLENPPQLNYFVPLTRLQTEKKVRAMDLYASQTRPAPNPRSGSTLRTLAHLRGSQCATDYAEAFVCLRQIIS